MNEPSASMPRIATGTSTRLPVAGSIVIAPVSPSYPSASAECLSAVSAVELGLVTVMLYV